MKSGLTENKGVRQRPDEGFRRWYLNEYFELILWFDQEGGQLTGFQLCLDRNRQERAFTWTNEYSSNHLVSSSLVEPGISKQSTGILTGQGKRVTEAELARLRDERGDLDSEVLETVITKILDRQRSEDPR